MRHRAWEVKRCMTGNLAHWHRNHSTIDGTGRCTAHARCHHPFLVTVTCQNGKHITDCQGPASTVDNYRSGTPAAAWCLSFQKISAEDGGSSVCGFTHSNATTPIPTVCPHGSNRGTSPPVISVNFSAALPCMDVNSINLSRSLEVMGILHD